MDKNMEDKNEQKNRRSFLQGFSLSSFFLGIGLCAAVAFAAINLFGSKSADVDNKPGHTFSVDLTGVPEGTELVPGDVQQLSPSVHNGSTTDYIYSFVKVSFNPDVYEIVDASWELVSEEPGEAIFSYSSGSEMIPVGIGEDANFTAGMKVIATGDVFNALNEESLKYTVTGYGIGTEISRSGNLDAWADYENAESGY